MLNVRRWFVVVVRVRIYFSILEYDIILRAIYGYHTGHTYEFVGPHICTLYVSITVWEYIHMIGEMNSHRYEISFQLKISLQCSVSSLLVFTWIAAKWNSNQHEFDICHFDRNEISNRHEVFMWTKFTRSEMNRRRLVEYCV